MMNRPPAAIRRALLAWFRRHARPLPWRKTKDPYAVWISEVMLQQTAISTAIPYYDRFLRAFPTVERLAAAPLEQVLGLWSGLGYYRRAHSLHAAAKKIANEYGGRFPRDYEAARSLPGIGAYTASAVLSIAYGVPRAALDGNVARVIARLLALPPSFRETGFRTALRNELERLLSRRRPGEFNQALMELGQSVCRPRAPRCHACPLRSWCAAYKEGCPERYPASRPRRAMETHYLATAWITRDRRLDGTPIKEALLVRGLEEGLLDELWNFPGAFGRSRAEALRRLKARSAELLPAGIRWSRPAGELHHGITYRSLTVHVYPATLPAGGGGGAARWFDLAQLGNAAVSQLTRKIAAAMSGKSGTPTGFTM
jgi:A/G-specific adenine glycosylase